MSFSACSEDELSSESVITSDSGNNSTKTDFDKWLTVNYVQPYNIEFKYRYEYNETDKTFYTVPADYNQSVELAHIVKYTCVEAYNEVGSVEFTRRYFPKMFFLIGEFEYKNNGTMILGTAESGKKILLTGVNNLDKKVSLLTQKILIATVIIGGAFQLVGIWYGSHLTNQQNASESASTYEYRKQESKSMEELRREIEILKAGKK